MRIGSLFSGYEGLGMAAQQVLGGDIAWVSDIDPGACKILAHHYPDVPNLGDISVVDWSQVEPVDVMTGGFPCQDLSLAGLRKGLRPDTRSGLWTQFAYAIDQLRPGLVLIENVRGLLSAGADSSVESCPWCVGDDGKPSLRALGAVLGDLAGLGYDASWQGLRASDVGAPHGRFRVFIIAWPAADTEGQRWSQGWTEPARQLGGLHASVSGRDAAAHPSDDGWAWAGCAWHGRSGSADHGHAAADAHGDGLEGVGRVIPIGRDADGRGSADVAWGQYEPAIRQWERVTRSAPAPTEPNKNGHPRLSPRFVEWMMGLPAGWVTDVPGLTRNEQLKALGNGVVPQQAAEALRILLPDIEAMAA